jgi:hypothetical protein
MSMERQIKPMRNFSRSTPFEETVGDLEELTNVDGAIIAQIGKIALVLPPEMEQKLRPHLRSRIGILGTDIPGKEYLVRIIPEKGPNHELAEKICTEAEAENDMEDNPE